MTPGDYYRAIYSSLWQSFERSDWVLGAGRELITRLGFGPYDLHVTAQPVSELWKLAVEWGLEVFVPARGRDAILFPFDFEVTLAEETARLYTDPGSQAHYFRKYIHPVARYLERFATERRLPYLLDYTPSGGHLLFYAVKGTAGWHAADGIGAVEDDLAAAYRWTEPGDLKRTIPVGDEEGRVFSGLGRLAEFIGLRIIRDAGRLIDWSGPDRLSVHLCDAAEKAVSIDVSWAGDPVFMRIMRAPGGLHKKNLHRHGIAHHGPLADVKGAFYDSHLAHRVTDRPDELARAMWNLERAAAHNRGTPGYIPFANEGLARLVEEYRATPLFRRHREFDATADLPRGEAKRRALADSRLHPKTRDMVTWPHPRLLQPVTLKKLVRDFLDRGWSARHAANVIRDCYSDPEYDWSVNWLKYPADTRAKFWARIYASVYHLENGERLVE